MLPSEGEYLQGNRTGKLDHSSCSTLYLPTTLSCNPLHHQKQLSVTGFHVCLRHEKSILANCHILSPERLYTTVFLLGLLYPVFTTNVPLGTNKET